MSPLVERVAIVSLKWDDASIPDNARKGISRGDDMRRYQS
jgi:hypothetical protein